MIKAIGSICLLLCWSCLVSATWYEDKQGIMGTNIQVEVWAEYPDRGQQAIDAVMTEMERINQLMSPYIATSELAILNAQAAQHPVVVCEELFELIKLSLALSVETNGAFDITFASIGYLYDYRRHEKPSDEQVKALLPAINFHHVVLNETQKSVYFSHPKVKIDLGGIAKGHAVDNAIALLQKLGIEHALVTAGGDTRLLGDRRGKPWMVGIRDPRHADKQAVVLPLENIALSTSGDYERYFEQDGVRYHHILSPKSGTSSYQVQSVSIIGPRSTLNDALSTAVFVLGVQEGIDLLNRTPGYDGLILDNQRKLHYSKDLAP
ncbi:FAD:protein FMN transferase [Paraglaciecola sp.]|uniref:FAD:protein FMN transferase n=1 Tax=Paraglaciecola sp. TaxID=1920173 RepID=UPI00273F5687|nr:FAD:protein FMN transferase [Paraglaciecola sp.]MDP5032357.1 FAD:protein FMN transferase [Paraglaciecola sp.]